MRFRDVLLPPKVPGLPCISSPRFKTSIGVSAGGGETVNQEWDHPLRSFNLPEAVARDWATVQELGDHFFIMRGPNHTWPFRNPHDFASCPLERPNQAPTVAMDDQALGTGDGFTDSFRLTKTYSRGGFAYTRFVHLPVLASVLVAADGVLVPAADYSVTRGGKTGGTVTFDVPPADGAELTAGYLFHEEVRFESDDSFEAILRSLRQSGFSDLTLIEVRPC